MAQPTCNPPVSKNFLVSRVSCFPQAYQYAREARKMLRKSGSDKYIRAAVNSPVENTSCDPLRRPSQTLYGRHCGYMCSLLPSLD